VISFPPPAMMLAHERRRSIRFGVGPPSHPTVLDAFHDDVPMNSQGEHVRRVLHSMGVAFTDPFTTPGAMAFWSAVDPGEKARWNAPIVALRAPKPHVFFLDYSFAIVLAQAAGKTPEQTPGKALAAIEEVPWP
jgi:hypothetical protein